MFGLMRGIKQRPLLIDEDRGVTDVRYVVVDTELTGLDEKRDSIVSLGAVQMSGGAIDIGSAFNQLVRPETALSAESVVIHGITPAEVDAKPGIADALSRFTAFCGDDVLVGHFLSIDLAFINREMKRLSGRPLRNPVVDTFSVYEWLRKRRKTRECRGYKLYDIAPCFGIPVNGGHNALMDAFITAQLFQRFLPRLAEAGVRDIGGLLRIGVPFEGGDRFRLSGEFSNF